VGKTLMSERELRRVGILKHRSAGRASNRAKPKKVRERALRLVPKKYSGAAGERFGPTLAAEHPASVVRRKSELQPPLGSDRGAAPRLPLVGTDPLETSFRQQLEWPEGIHGKGTFLSRFAA